VATGTKRRGYETLRDMLLSVGVILAGVLIFVALQPKDDGNPIPRVDYRPQVDLLRNSAPYAVVIPDPLPAGWEVNYTRISATPAAELHMGLVLQRDRFAQLDETNRPTPTYFADAKVPEQPAGTVDVAGATYEVRRTGSGADERVGLIRRLPNGAVLTLTDGGSSNGATYDELLALAASLREQPIPPGR